MRPRSLLLPLILGLSTVATAKPIKTQSVEVKSRTIVAFAPPELNGSKDEGAVEALAHLRFAIEDTYKCLQPMKLSIQFHFTDRIVLRNGKSNDVLQVHKLGQAVGAVIAEPGRKPQVVYSVDGPSTLQFLLPQAAAKYWAIKGCEQ